MNGEFEMTQLTQARFTDAKLAKQFLLAGRAHATLVSQKTGVRYTFRVRKAKEGDVFFVSVLNGPTYLYLGMIDTAGKFKLTRKSQFTAENPEYKAFDFMWRNLTFGFISSTMEFWHEGRCGRCGKRLTVPGSIDLGIGPDCAKLMGLGPDILDAYLGAAA